MLIIDASHLGSIVVNYGQDQALFSMRAAFSVLVTFVCVNQALEVTSPVIGLALLPMTYLIVEGMNTDYVSALILTVFWAVWMVTLLVPFFLLVGKFIIMVVYLPLVGVRTQARRSCDSYVPLLLTWTWDKTTSLGMDDIVYWQSRITALYEYNPGQKISDDFLVMGSVPMASDVANVMVTEPYNIGCVVNMCKEYKGPQQEYLKRGYAFPCSH